MVLQQVKNSFYKDEILRNLLNTKYYPFNIVTDITRSLHPYHKVDFSLL